MSSLLGTRIGHFRVVDLLGKGGMGEVYVGYDEKLERKVALKSLRAERRPDDEAKLRFQREARALSQLAHPNICQIFDYIEGDDADILVLELIEGRTLGSAMKAGLDERTKLRIAEQVAGVLVAAHGKGIVHRDLKPENVMLTAGDQVKVLDFGLSRWQQDEAEIADTIAQADAPRAELPLLDDQGTEIVAPEPRPDPAHGSSSSHASSSGALTTIGAIMGTLRYMSPEQARGEVATAASDLYSFGLLLQELFTGKPPYEKDPDAMVLLRKAIAGETLPVEGIDPDLAALIGRLKSLAPAARPSAVDTAERLAWIRLKPQRRRRRLLRAAATAVLALFAAAMTVQSVRLARAERTARHEAATAAQVSDFLLGLFKVSDPGEAKGNSVTARELLDKGALRIEKELKDQPVVQARLMDTMGVVYRRLGLFATARPLAEGALAIREKSLGPDAADVAASLANLGELDAVQGRFADAEKRYLRSLAIREKVLGPEHLDVAASLNSLASLYRRQGKYADAVPLFLRSVKIQEKALGADDPEVATSLNRVANLLADQGKYAEAEPLYQRSLAIREKALGPDHPDVARSLNNLAGLYVNQGRNAEAEPLFKRSLAIWEKVLGPDHTDVAGSLANLATVYTEERKYAEAEPLLRRSLAIREKALGPDHPDVAVSLGNLADLYRAEGRYAEAEPLYNRALAVEEKALGPGHPDVADVLNGLGELTARQGRTAEAEALFRRSLAIRENALGKDHPVVAQSLVNLAALAARAGKRADALELLRRALPGGAGTPYLAALAKSPDFASVRGDPEFERIAAEVTKRAETGAKGGKTAR